MSTARVQKEENAQQLHDELAHMPHAILVDFQRLNVEGATSLRRKLREGDARLRVVKNSTALRAIEDLPLAELRDVFVGQTAIAYTDGDIVALARTLREFAKEFDTPSFKAGIVDGEPISAEEFDTLAQLPPREELIAKALYLMNYPLTGLVTALNAILQGFVVVLDQIRDKREAAGESGTETEVAVKPAKEAPAEAAAAAEPAEAPEEPATEAEAAAEPAEVAEEPATEAEAAPEPVEAPEEPAPEPEEAAEPDGDAAEDEAKEE